MAECPQCHGKKILELFASIETCTLCEGRGVLESPPADLALTTSDALAKSNVILTPATTGLFTLSSGSWETSGGSGGGYGGTITLYAGSGGSGSGNLGSGNLGSGNLGGVGGSGGMLTTGNLSSSSFELREWAVAQMQEVTSDNAPAAMLEDPYWGGTQGMGLHNFSDALAVLEHHGYSGAFFLVSCRDFASLRMLPESSCVVWSQNRLFLFGVEVVRDRRVPLRYAAAVAPDRKLSLIRGM